MDAEDLLDSIRDDQRTPLSRLGSSKALYALTEGEMDDGVVLAAMADLARRAESTFDEWAVAPAPEAAATASDHRQAIDAEGTTDEPSGMTAALADLDGDAARLGGLLGWTLVAEKYAEQATGYFTGQADPSTASTFREQGADLEALRSAALDALRDADDREVAEAAAVSVIQAAYEDYVATLESLGVNPKPVC